MRSFVVHFFFSFFRTLCGWFNHLVVLIVVPFISFTWLVVVAEANLRCGVIFLKKVVVTVLAVFLSFCSWLPDLPWVFISLKDRASFLGLIRHCFLVNATQECLIFDFSFSVESCLFMCLSVMRFFSSQVLPILITVSGWCYLFALLIFFPLINSTGVVAVALVNFSLERFVSIKLSQIGSFHKLLVLATECFFNFDIFEIYSDAFLVWYCVVDMLRVHGSTMFLVLVFMFLKFFILCVYPWCDLL